MESGTLYTEQTANFAVQKEDWTGRLAVLREKIIEHGDDIRAQKLLSLIEKWQNNEFAIGFCGHFSAGKSSMINYFWEENLLPSSPIPTSANLVKVKSGQPYARIYFKERAPLQFAYPYDIETVKKYCVDGDEVEAVEISHPSKYFPRDLVLLDTPGIDSTDDAHRVATTSSLHLADVIFYVMDYNHVQSELNFQFAKDMKEQGKRLYIVINQIDKHEAAELDFETYQASVVSAFRSWRVEPDGIYYTSLADSNHPYNQIDELKQFILSLLAHKDEYLFQNGWNTALTFIREHKEWYAENHFEQIEMEGMSPEERQRIHNVYKKLQAKIDANQQTVERFKQTIQNELTKILNNAMLTPYDTRELGKTYLQSMQRDFKVGLFFAKKKTLAERESRLQSFYHHFRERVSTQLDWHVKQLLVQTAKSYGIEDDDLFQSIYDEAVEIPASLLQENVNQGATVNGQYVLHYCQEVSDATKNKYKLFASEQIDKLYALLKTRVEKENKQLNEELLRVQKQVQMVELLSRHEEVEKQLISAAMAILEGRVSKEDCEAAIQRLPESKDVTVVREVQLEKEDVSTDAVDDHADREPITATETKKEREQDRRARLLEMAKRLQTSADAIKDIKGLEARSEELRQRALRLQNRRYTISLFGAFSAGKSSFANALMGAQVLPVSPNPTTAAINQIKPVDDDHPHGTVIVKLKSEEQLLADVRASFSFFDIEINSLLHVEETIQQVDPKDLNAKAKLQFSFLKAVERGFSQYEKHSGEEIIVDLNTFTQYVSEEEKACFVEWIELYYDCPLTEQGITLVDTPGADSINARHTGVAFEYIKNADAILYVTYYNHAFSQADREFLIQLGRVKDTFELDKMFFILNAADLAKSDAELSLVEKHIEDNLLQYGIRRPRIYPLSSQRALLEQLEKRQQLTAAQADRLEQLRRDESLQRLKGSGIEAFEQSFFSFTIDELATMAIQAANTELENTVQTLQEWVDAAKQSARDRQHQRTKTEEVERLICADLEAADFAVEQKALQQEIDELLYYVKERVFLRYKDEFTQFFNPAVLRDEKRAVKEQLQTCLKELFDFITFDLVQEIRATALRIESFINKQLKSIHEGMQKSIHAKDSAVLLREFEAVSFDLPSFCEQLDHSALEKLSPHLAIYKNNKQFFEQDGKIALQNALEEELQMPVDAFLQTNRQTLSDYYLERMQTTFTEMQRQMTDQVRQFFSGKLASLSDQIDIAQLEKARQVLLY